MTDHVLARQPIRSAHQSATPWLATLAPGDVWPLAAVPTLRWLRVERGCLWVTAAARQPGPVPREADIWLQPGDSLALPPGSSWLLQAWPGADVMLLEQAAVPRTHAPGVRASSRVPGLRARLLRWLCDLQGWLPSAWGGACPVRR